MKDEKQNSVVNELLEKLDRGVVDFCNSEKWIQYLKCQTMFHHYSFNNIILIIMQCPFATQVAGMKTWNKLNRKVIKGSKAIKIIKPICKKVEVESNGENEIKNLVVAFQYTNVFDISQTDGEEVPSICETLQGESSSAKTILRALEEIISIPIVMENTGRANGYYSAKKNIIALKDGSSINQMAKTLVHEYAHYQIHERRIDLTEFLEENEEDYSILYGVEEVIVESIAYIVNNYFGNDTGDYSFEYITSWSRGNPGEIKKVGSIIQRLSHEFIEDIEKFRSNSLMAIG